MSREDEMFEAAELERISFECPKCGTQIVFRATAPDTVETPYQCPACREDYVDVSRTLEAYRAFHKQVLKSGKAIRLHARRS